MLDYFINDWFSTSWGDTNSYELDEEYVIEVQATGLKKSDIKVEFDNDGALHIEGKVSDKPEKRRWLRREFRSSSFNRRIILPDDVDPANVSATCENGILIIRIGKKVPEKPKLRQIEVG